MNIPEPMFTPVYDLGNGEDTTMLTVIKQNREDEKNTRSIIFASLTSPFQSSHERQTGLCANRATVRK